MHPLIARLVAEAPVVTDGAWGTELLARGLAASACADEWNLSHPDLVEQVARGYVEAGSRVLLTNTFRANRLALRAHGLADRTAEINRAGVAISRRAAGGAALVFASLGPSGRRLPTGEVGEGELREAFAEQARALADAGADALVLETFSDLGEARVAVGAARETGLPVVACLVFDSGKDPGPTPEQAAETLTAAGADVIGANCGRGVAGFVPVCRRLRAGTDLPIWVKANAGLPRIVEGRLVYPVTPDEWAGHGPALRDAGASFLGGCCGTTPAFIRALRRALAG
jgi:methionine synthase I (cobalamin-dependent)